MEKKYFRNGGNAYVKAVFAGDDDDNTVYYRLVINEKWSDDFIRGYTEGFIRVSENVINPYVLPAVEIYYLTRNEWLEEQAEKKEKRRMKNGTGI